MGRGRARAGGDAGAPGATAELSGDLAARRAPKPARGRARRGYAEPMPSRLDSTRSASRGRSTRRWPDVACPRAGRAGVADRSGRRSRGARRGRGARRSRRGRAAARSPRARRGRARRPPRRPAPAPARRACPRARSRCCACSTSRAGGSARWWPEPRALVVAEAVGTHEFDTLGAAPAGVHPLLRLFPPGALRRLDPEHLLPGHGPPLHGPAAAEGLRAAYARSRRDLPRLVRARRAAWHGPVAVSRAATSGGRRARRARSSCASARRWPPAQRLDHALEVAHVADLHAQHGVRLARHGDRAHHLRDPLDGREHVAAARCAPRSRPRRSPRSRGRAARRRRRPRSRGSRPSPPAGRRGA